MTTGVSVDIQLAHGDWRDQSACRDEDPELFFTNTPEAVEMAKAVCLLCPVVGDCQRWASENGIEFGTWGGETDIERRQRMANEIRSGSRIRNVGVCEQCRKPYHRKKPDQRFCDPDCYKRSLPSAAGTDCGTMKAARRHRRHGQDLDKACQLAEALYRAQLRAAEKCAEANS